VPLVTPFAGSGTLDEAALARLVELQVAGGVAGIFVLGTTGEVRRCRANCAAVCGASVEAGEQARGGFLRAGRHPAGGFGGSNEFFHAGADAVVAHPPVSEKVRSKNWANGTKRCSTGSKGRCCSTHADDHGRFDSAGCGGAIAGHPKLAGIKDSENNPKRHEELLHRFSGKKDFSVFIGVGA